MSGHGGVARKQDAAIGALLSQSTISAAAESVGIGEATLRRWLKDAGFLAAYRGARGDTLEHCIALLQKAGSEAVEALQQSLQATSEGVRLRAACAILDYSLKGIECWTWRSGSPCLRDYQVRLNGRVTKLEARLAATAPEDDAEEQLWAQFFASARRWPEDREPTEDQILEADRMAAREVFASCRGIGMKPSISAMNILAHCQTEG